MVCPHRKIGYLVLNQVSKADPDALLCVASGAVVVTVIHVVLGWVSCCVLQLSMLRVEVHSVTIISLTSAKSY
jgi:hypothetical protein